ncbi:NAD-dependent epimerase/dehydratase family protein [Thermincola potens]|uniref:NAD-dependent epimerase/dehydratase n=1 Tax=Thermincola potens (strain JR) TaxID=635013 RepID=D5XCZ1_THEPJ|nr:NAD-dependent epimerase/dehydratase family protein [Thermincola potens]ADG83667.1 NAD-dependent epimerase/dehydratase [Thermincola potens JR]
MKVLVTGGAGFIGSHIVDRLILEGYEVVVADNLSTGSPANINAESRFYQVDITGDDLQDLFAKEKPEVVIHHAAQADVQVAQREPVFDSMTNILGTVNLLQCCITYNAKKLIYASSAAVYGAPCYLPVDENHPVNPISNYGISKYVPELYIKAFHKNFNLNYTILRYANVYGPRQGLKGEGGVVFLFARRFLAGEPPLIYGDGEQTRDFVFVEDIVNANLLALEQGDGMVINIGTGAQVSVNDLCSRFREIFKSDLRAEYLEPRPGDIKKSVFDISLAKNVLGWQPLVSLETGLRQTIEFYRDIWREV